MYIKKGDIVKIYGSKVKLKIEKEQTGDYHVGITAKRKPMRVTDDRISQILKDGKEVYSNVGTGEC